MTNMSGAEFIASFLERNGVTHVFLMQSVLVNTQKALVRSNRVQPVVAHSEKSAAYMADGYARACGRPGVCLAQKIGASNLAAGLRDAYLACSPVIAMAGGAYLETQDRHTYQQVDDMTAFKPVTKFSARVDLLDRLPDVMRQAFRAATVGTPGPVYVEVAGHSGEPIEDALGDLDVSVDTAFQCLPPFRPAPPADAVGAAIERLAAAERPILVAGGGVRASGAESELVAFAERLQIPVATALNAKDTVPGAHPLSVGVPGTYSRESANRAILESDLVFFIGSHTSSQLTCNWQVPRRGTAVMQLDINGEELGRHYPNDVSLIGDAKTGLAMLIEAAQGEDASRRQDWVARTQSLVERWRTEMAPHMSSDASPVRPERVCSVLSEWLPPDAILVSDTGHSGMWTGGVVDLKSGQSYLRAAGSLGWSFPAGIGAKLAQPTRPVVVFSGDGGFWYHFPDLETAVRANVPLITIVNNNSSFNQGMHIDAADGYYAPGTWQFEAVDFARVAEDLGALGIRVEKPEELVHALDRALASGRPSVIDVVSDIRAQAPEAFLGEPA